MNVQTSNEEFKTATYFTYNRVAIAWGQNNAEEYLYKLTILEDADSIVFYPGFEQSFNTLEEIAFFILQAIKESSMTAESHNPEKAKKPISDIQKLISLIYIVFTEG